MKPKIGGSKTFARLSEMDMKTMDALIVEGFACNRSDFTRAAIRRYIDECLKKRRDYAASN